MAHRVTRVDVVDAYDPAGLVHVDLELAAASASFDCASSAQDAGRGSAQDARAGKAVEETALALGQAHLVEVARNGVNGGSKNGGAPEKTSAGSKRRAAATAEQRERVVAMLRAGGNRKAIAEACGVAVSTVYDIRLLVIAAGQLGAAA